MSKKVHETEGKDMKHASDGEGRGLTDAQKAHVERNRQRALLLKQARLSEHPYTKNGQKMKGHNQVIDTGAGFFLDEEEEKIRTEVQQQLGPVILKTSDHLLCEGCDREFLESLFFDRFDVSVCDNCRMEDEKYALITKTEAKRRYLLQDADLDIREPPLKYLVKKNPHNQQWGDMKLFLELQVQARCLEVWGDEDKLEEARAERAAKKEKTKKKKFEKRVKELRMAVRSSTWRKEVLRHEHDYGAESYSEATEEYSKTCRTCGHVLTFEKM